MIATNGATKPSMNEANERDPFNNNSYGTLVDQAYKMVSLPVLHGLRFLLSTNGKEQTPRGQTRWIRYGRLVSAIRSSGTGGTCRRFVPSFLRIGGPSTTMSFRLRNVCPLISGRTGSRAWQALSSGHFSRLPRRGCSL